MGTEGSFKGAACILTKAGKSLGKESEIWAVVGIGFD